MNAQLAWRSLSGDPLDGEALVRLVYVDEAGIGKPAEEPYTVVAGVIVHADTDLAALERYLEALVVRHIPEHLRAGFVFHAAHIFNGGGPVFKRPPKDLVGPAEWPMERRYAIADDLAKAFRKFRLPVAFGFLKRDAIRSDFGLPDALSDKDVNIFGHAATFIQCCMTVERWMRESHPNEVCLMIVEDNDQARSNIRAAQKTYQDPSRVHHLGEGEDKFFPFKKIKEDPLFQPKRSHSVLQLADFAAYVGKKMRMQDLRYRRFVQPVLDVAITFVDP